MKKKRRVFPAKPVLILSASALLLIGSTIGSTQAALTYYSENYSAQVNMDNIGVTLMENNEAVSYNNYADTDGNNGKTGGLLNNLLGEGEKIAPGKTYEEKLHVQNSGNIDTFVRVILTKSWQDAEGKKNTVLSPDLIELNVLEQGGWTVAATESSPERIVLYYTNLLPAGEATPDFTDTIRINNEITKKVSKVTEGNTIRYVFDYNGYTFNVDAEVNAVQTHSAAEAIKSAWGVDVTVSPDETSYSLQ